MLRTPGGTWLDTLEGDLYADDGFGNLVRVRWARALYSIFQ